MNRCVFEMIRNQWNNSNNIFNSNCHWRDHCVGSWKPEKQIAGNYKGPEDGKQPVRPFCEGAGQGALGTGLGWSMCTELPGGAASLGSHACDGWTSSGRTGRSQWPLTGPRTLITYLRASLHCSSEGLGLPDASEEASPGLSETVKFTEIRFPRESYRSVVSRRLLPACWREKAWTHPTVNASHSLHF